MKQLMRREVISHHQLRHENVLKLLGVVSDEVHSFAIIMPWHSDNAIQYLEHYGDPKGRVEAFFRIVSFYPQLSVSLVLPGPCQVLGATSGLEYLHALLPIVIHGDVKGVRFSVTRCDCVNIFSQLRTGEHTGIRVGRCIALRLRLNSHSARGFSLEDYPE